MFSRLCGSKRERCPPRMDERKGRQGRKGAAVAVGDGPPAERRRLTQAVRARERIRARSPRAFVPGPEPACARRVATPVADRYRGSLAARRVTPFAALAAFAFNRPFAAL